MRLSPLDIKSQDFTKALRGYDPEDVQTFLGMLAGQWEDLLAEQRRADEKVRELQAKLEHYERVEEALQEALQTAREGSRQALENAKQEAATIVKKAVGEAEDLTRGAALQRDTLLHEIDSLKIRREEMVARLRAFLTAEIEVLSRFDERTRPDDAALQMPEPLPATGAALLAGGSPVVLDPDEPARLPEIDTAPAAPVAHVATPALPDEVPLDTGALDAVLEAMSTAPEEAPAAHPTPSVEVSSPELTEEPPLAPPPPAAPPPASPSAPSPPAPDGAIEIEFGNEASPQAFTIDEDPLSFHVFEPSSMEPSARPVDNSGKPAPGYASDEAPRRPDDTWIVRPTAAASAAEASPSDDAHAATSEDIEKIKKILNDLD